MVSLDQSAVGQAEAPAVPCPLCDAAEPPITRRAAEPVPSGVPALRSPVRLARVERHAPAHRLPQERHTLRRAIVHLTAEYHGYARTGGLAEAVAGLAASQVRSGERVFVFVPLYASVRAATRALEPVGEPGRVAIGARDAAVQFFRDASRGAGPTVCFVDVAGCFDRPGLYGDASGDYADNHERFALFARAALLGIEQFVPGPLLLHAHDWHAALAPVYMRTHPALAARFADTPTVLSVHNAGYQGHFGADVMPALALPDDLWHMDRMEWYGRLNLLKGGLVFCDAAVTVSPAHATELRTEEGGFGLHDTFRHLGSRLVGICNGIEPRSWDPGCDPHIAANYTAVDLRNKAVCKEALQRLLGLAVDADVPVIGMSSRLAGQKGFDIVLRSERLRAADVQLIVIGEGEAHIRSAMMALAAEFPGRMVCTGTFTDLLEHQLMAGADAVLMPSLYEPCGLTQMHALRYGAPVIGRRVGGIGDTVDDGRTGFLFDAYDAAALDGALARALTHYRDRNAWHAMMRRAMRRDFGWDHAMVDYAAVYHQAERRVLAPV